MAASLSIYRLRYSFSFTHSGDPLNPGSSSLYTFYQLSSGVVSLYMQLTVETNVTANVVRFLPSPTSGLAPFIVSRGLTGTLELIFSEVTISGDSFIHQGYELIYNGTTLTTGAAGTLNPFASTSGSIAGIVNIGFGPWLKTTRGASMVGGIDFKLQSSDSSWLTFPVAVPPGVPVSISTTNSANLISYNNSATDWCETYAATNEKPKLRRFSAANFGMRLSRTAVPSVDYSLNGTHTNAIPALSAASGDITGTAGALETDLLERDHYIGVVQLSGSDSYRFPSRVDGSAANADGRYMNEVVDRWSRFTAPTNGVTVDGVVQTTNYGSSHRFQTLSDGRITRINFGALNQKPGIIAAEVCSHTPTSSASYSSASSSLYLAPSGSKTVTGTGVTFTGGEAQIVLASLSVTPFCYGLLADTIDFTATGTGLRYFLEDAAGRRKEVPVSPSVSLAVRGSRHTVGSWAQDWGTRALRNGSGVAVADIYPDIPANGKSDTIWPDVSPLKAIGSLLGLDGAWAKLIITCTSGSIVITHPTLTRTSDLEFIQESPDATLVGTGTRWVRFGGANVTGSSPTIDLPGYPTTLLNWLSWKRLVLEGKAYDDGRNTEIVSLGFASGSSPTNRHFIDGAVSSYFFGAQLHPHFMWPNVSGSMDQGVGATLDRWEHAAIGAKSFGFGAALELYDSGGTLVSTPGTPVGDLYPSSWEPTTWAKDHTLKHNGKAVATVRPSWCFTGASNPASRLFKAIANARQAWPMYFQVQEDSDGNLDALREQWLNPSASLPVVSSPVTGEELQGAALCLPQSPSAPVWLAVGYSETIYVLTSYDDQETWSTPVSTLTNARFPQIVWGSPSLIAGMRGDSEDEPGVIVGKVRELGDSAWGTEFTFQSGGSDIRVENEPFAICSEASGTALVLAARKEGETDVTNWLSYDGGLTWAEVV